VRSGTDITGYGLLGHAVELASASAEDASIRLQIETARVPALPGVFDYIEAGYLTRGSARNPEHFGGQVVAAANVTAALKTLLWEAETSGGLLLAVPPEGLSRFRAVCEGEEQPFWEIGTVVPARADQPVIRLV
jgi:selenide,water dikinase